MKIKELHLFTNNLIETEAFYTTVLGIPARTKTPKKISFTIGETQLFFSISNDKPEYHIAFEIPNNQLEEALEWLQIKTALLPVSKNTNISSFELWNATSFYFFDNNFNLLEFICRKNSNTGSSVEFSSSSILYASEIGIVTDNVPKLSQQIKKKYFLPIYEKQPAQENFTAIGDEQGLLILVNSNRNWFPTNRPALNFPMKIVFENNNVTSELSFL